MKTIIANWKMNVGVRESVALARTTLLALRGRKLIPELIVCPPFVALSEVRKAVARSSVSLGAQDVFWKDSGAFTGEISGRMLSELEVSHVIIGHSERRFVFGETDEMIMLKTVHALESGLVPIVCVGETKEQKDGGDAVEIVKTQVKTIFDGVRARTRGKLYIAYEPVWAIGTGNVCSVEDTIKMHAAIRESAAKFFEQDRVAVIYGGSVDEKNAYGLLREKQIEGLLVGGASVKINQFKEIIASACEVMEAQEG